LTIRQSRRRLEAFEKDERERELTNLADFLARTTTVGGLMPLFRKFARE